MKQVTLALAVTLLAGCPPLPQGIDQTFEAGVAAGYAQAQDDIEQLRTELARLTVDVDALQAELDVTHALADENEARVSEVEDRVDSADLALLTLSTDLDVLTFDALRTDDLEIYPNETESADGGAYYALPDDGAWHQLELVETGCRFVYVKLKIRATAVGGDVDTVRAIWYAVGNSGLGDVPVVEGAAPFGGRGSLLHTFTDALSPEQAGVAYAWVDMEAERDLFVLLTPPDAVGVGNALTTAAVAHLGCIR